ncbi:MAG: Hsp70 family protein [Candidatus Poribacteria bacterium]|nr:Hsp70 family protein [Candidatus Poribacteria bacterium]
MVDAVCSKCNVGWVIYSHDKYCGYCGCSVFDFSVKWKEEPWIYAGDGANFHDLTILVKNTGAYPITFQPIRPSRNNTIQFLDANDKSFEVEAGKSRALQIQVNPAKLAQNPETITVRVKDVPPNLEREKTLRLEALPHPEFKLTPNPLVVRHRKGEEKVTEDLHIEVLQSQFYIDDIKVTRGSVLRTGYSTQLHQKNSATKKIKLEIDCNRLTDEPNEVKLNFKLQDFSQPIEKRIKIQREIVPEPPKLQLPSTQLNLDITQEREKAHTIILQNRGEQLLTIKNIKFNDPSSVLQLPNLEYPINIKAGEQENVELQISAAGIEHGDYPINFTIYSNCVDATKYEGVLNVKVNELEEYPHYLAIDFGTTNSCCAYIDPETYEPKLIPLDTEANPPEIMPSTIIYHTQPNNGKAYHVGYDAETHRTSEIDGPYYITSIKRWLGYQWKRYFPEKQNIQPCDVVADIFKHIIQQAEKYLDTVATQSRVKRCIVTYPTMFPHEQRADLRRAFKKIGINDVILIDEGSAASIATILQRRVKDTSKGYRMLVYDFGGGTIDIVLSQVTYNDGEIRFEPIASGGNPRYGGEDVTHAIVKDVLKKLKTKIRHVNPDLNFEIPYYDYRKTPTSSKNTNIDRAMLTNTAILYEQAERMKKELSEKTQTVKYFALSVIIGTDIRSFDSLTQGDISVQLSTQQLQKIIEPGLSKTFDDIDAMIEVNDRLLPDIVILAGQSSKMRAVEQMMRDHFQKRYRKSINVQLGDPPKECVVLGAMIYGRHLTVPVTEGNWLEYVDSANITHSRLGIIAQTKEGQPFFREVIPKGKRIPKDSKNTIDFQPRSSQTYIDVHEHFGTDDDLSNSSQIASYTLKLPAEVTKDELRKARLEMTVKADSEIELVAHVGGKKYKTEVKRINPPFADKI